MSPRTSSDVTLAPGLLVTAVGVIEETNNGLALWVLPRWRTPHKLEGGRVNISLDPSIEELPPATQIVVVSGEWTEGGSISDATLRRTASAPAPVTVRSPAERRPARSITEEELLATVAGARSLAGDLMLSSGMEQDTVSIQVLHLTAEVQAWLAQLSDVPLEVAVSVVPLGGLTSDR